MVSNVSVPRCLSQFGLENSCNILYSTDSVQCDRCKRYFHMRCVQPPLIAKPSRGYGWTCAPCSRRHEQEVDSHEVRHATPQAAPKQLKSNAPAPRGRGRPRKDKLQAEREENFPVKHFNMWPFRYFGYAVLIPVVRFTVLTKGKATYRGRRYPW